MSQQLAGVLLWESATVTGQESQAHIRTHTEHWDGRVWKTVKSSEPVANTTWAHIWSDLRIHFLHALANTTEHRVWPHSQWENWTVQTVARQTNTQPPQLAQLQTTKALKEIPSILPKECKFCHALCQTGMKGNAHVQWQTQTHNTFVHQHWASCSPWNVHCHSGALTWNTGATQQRPPTRTTERIV